GTNGVVRGLDLVENMKRQTLDFGAQIYDLQDVKEVFLDGEQKVILSEDTEFYAKSVIIATGAEPRKLPADGENEFRGRGIHYC
ncbi:FAD-dependent oxidoreductase, partial [Cutibacterium acnes]